MLHCNRFLSRRKLQQASVADPEQRRLSHNTKVRSESSSSKAASASDVTSSAAHPCTLRRWRVCSRSPLLCWHPWLAALHELRGPAWPQEKLLVTMSVATFTSRLRSSLVTCGMSAEEAPLIASEEAQAQMFYMHLQWLACSWQGRRGMLRQHMGSLEC